jgi:uroporphyrinogen-III decarboxylase
MMTSKEKMIEAMTGELTGSFPVVIPYVYIFLRDHWEQVTDEPWWVASSWDIPALIRVQESLLKKLELDWVQSILCPSRRWRASHAMKERDGRFFLKDLFTGGAEEVRRPPVGGDKLSWIDSALVKSKEDVDTYLHIDDHEALVENGNLDWTTALVERFGQERFIVAPVAAPLWAVYQYLGFTGTLLSLIRNPDLVEYLLERLTLDGVEKLRAYAKAGVDGVWIEDCLCSANEISLKHFERFALPYSKMLVSEARRLGMKSVYYFCGDVGDRLEKIVGMRPDAVSLEESKKGFQIDIAWVDKVVGGRACLFGNLDAMNLLPNAAEEELRRELVRQVNVGRRSGRFVMSLGSPVTPGTRLARVREYVKVTRRLGRV